MDQNDYRVDNWQRCELDLAFGYDEEEGWLFVPGFYEGPDDPHPLKWHPLISAAVRSKTVPDGWLCLGLASIDFNDPHIQQLASRAISSLKIGLSESEVFGDKH